ncbi:TonB-dependent receptor [Cytophagaceae bacterium YF14B1]|uniref:TonB-dependent receptor n=2 Tax=Bacteria TaxID=2 RepID=A0AAE3UAJ3_9BACT|nr:TonB-dependent receptor [Xanthocytophaga flavus]MDJ1482839.1 TonB-dependent receptor [Xanthocytophaga flavus]
MKKKCTFFILLWLCWYVGAAQGIIKGKVIDDQNKQPLPGASIIVDGTNAGASANLSGEFELNVFTSGKVDLKISYLGYKPSTVSVEVVSGKVTTVTIPLRNESFEILGVTITGQLQGQARALNQQRTADNIKNVVSADQIGRFPDPNAAEALQRVPGVNIERDQGEGRYVLVRGLSPQFTNISVNGEQIPSPEAGVRYVALDAIPSDQLSSLEVSKSLTPDMDGDAIGGSVNLITRTAQSGITTLNGTLAGGYNNLMKRGNWQGSLQYGQRLGKEEKLGVMLNISHYTNNLGSDNWERDTRDNVAEPEEHRFELRDYELTRTRFGSSATIDYKFNPNHQVYVRGLYSRFTDREWRRRYVFLPADDEVEHITKDRFEAQSVTSINVGANHLFGKFTLDYEGSYSYATQDTPFDNEAGFIASDVASDITFQTDYPRLSSTHYLDNTLYSFDSFETGHTFAKDRNITGKFNLGIPYQWGGNAGLIKVGGKVRFKEKSYAITQNKYEALSDIPDLSFFEGGLLDKNFIGNRYQLSPSVSIPSFIRYFNANPQNFELQIEDKAADEALESYTATEDVYAGYAMARQQFRKLMVLGGVRYERTNVSYQSSDVVFAPNGDLQQILPVSGKSNYEFFLPQLHFKYSANELTNIRLAGTFSYARPNFDQIIPAQEASLEDQIATVGNAALQPVKAFNLDFLAERYLGTIGIISGGFFYKKLDNFIYTRRFTGSYPLNSATPIATDLLITQVQNGKTADLLGVELAYQQNLNFLPGALSGLGVYLNYTYTHSSAIVQRNEAPETETLNLPGQAAHVGNASVSYQYKGFSARASLNFNGRYLSATGATTADDIYVKDRMQLDVTLGYTITKQWRVFTEFMNLTNQPFETYAGTRNFTTQREFYGWWTRFGIKFNILDKTK